MSNLELIQGTPEWLAMRQRYIGASDVPVILGLSPWMTPYQLWEVKLGLRTVETNAAMQRGKDMEEEARQVFIARTGIEVEPKVVFHPTIPYLMASLDGLSTTGYTMVEIKCVNIKDHISASKGVVPEKYYPQLQHQLEVTGLDDMNYFSYNSYSQYCILVKRDQPFIDKMLEAEKDFWRRVQEFDPPALCDADYVDMGYDEEWQSLSAAYVRASNDRKLLEKHEDALRDLLINKAEKKNARGYGIKLTKYVRKGAVDYSKIEVLQGIDLEQYRKKPIEAFRISET